MIRNKRDALPPGNNQIKIKNTCNDNLRTHMRYYDDGTLKYSISDNVRKNQVMNLSTDKRVIVAIVAAETSGDKDVFKDKCTKHERNFLR